ncbi:bromo adjacent y domain-containing 1 protein-like [Pyrus ussuriensis x Pyrus communis]|uniref:Bromo adjacent y domain-containing 1 protein-like n=1 Tax=Pyrus ussuriensis x Pyrus communis TaxID=2448454 RepID=A0A5N5GCW4_9ROSA|nr:bromo adjacent y domain-containing 1 protein-like [Pyrus ussuriensis x Pyrus communis]
MLEAKFSRTKSCRLNTNSGISPERATPGRRSAVTRLFSQLTPDLHLAVCNQTDYQTPYSPEEYPKTVPFQRQELV